MRGDGRAATVRHSVGMAYLARLLSNPRGEWHVFELAGTHGAATPDGRSFPLRGSGDVGPILDAAAKGAYRRRLEELAVDLEEAERWADIERVERVGLEIDAPILTDDARAANFTNEGGVDGRTRFLTNVMGTWLISETLRQWERDGTPADLVDILRAAPFNSPVRQQANLDPFNREVEVTPGRTFRNKTEDYGFSGQVDLDVGPGTLTSITAYRQYKAGGAGDVDYNVADIFYRDDDGNSFRQFKTFTQELRFQGSAFDDRLDYLFGGYYSNEKLLLVDNSKFGSQYGTFAACRVVATVNPDSV